VIAGPLTRYKMFWGGEWRAVTNLFAGQRPTYDAMRATSVVIYVDDDAWVSVAIDSPGMLMERFEQSKDTGRWELRS
jgi:hypothetical protein